MLIILRIFFPHQCHVYAHVSDTTNLLSKLPIRGYEKVELEIGITEQLTFEFGEKW